MDLKDVLERGVEEILPSREGLARLMEKKKITLYQGFDPTAKSLHIGNFIGLRKLAQFQELGHKVIFLVGDFTALIGDPTDKKDVRSKLTKKQVQQNFEKYKEQAGRIIDFGGANKALVKFNSEWLGKLSLEDVLELSSNFSVQQMIERSMFQNRLKEGRPIYIHEFFYPLMQGYDSLSMDVDLEIGGNDQLFNMMAGRSLMKTVKKKEKFVLTMKLLTDATGAKMGKTEGNAINLTDSPEEIFGKIMAFPDTHIDSAIELLTDLPMDFSADHSQMESKKAIGLDVVAQIYGAQKAKEAGEHFEKTFQDSNPDFEVFDIKEKRDLARAVANVAEVSVSDAKRLIQQGGVDVNGENAMDSSYKIKGGEEIKIGKKKFVKIK